MYNVELTAEEIKLIVSALAEKKSIDYKNAESCGSLAKKLSMAYVWQFHKEDTED